MQRKPTSGVPKLNLKRDGLASKSAPNSARSCKSEGQSSGQQSQQEEKYLAWKRRKEYRPASASKSKMPVKMTKSLTISSKMSNALREEERQPGRERAEGELTLLDSLVIDTSLNVSNKICSSAIDVLLQATKKFSVSDQDLLMNVETLSYILEDSHVETDEKQKQLSALLKNLKKLEHALELTESMMNMNTEKT